MKRAIWIIVIILIGGFFVNKYLENKAKNKAIKEANKAEEKRIEETIKASVAEMVTRTNAIETWEKDLSKVKQTRSEPILTVELERLWLTSRPILFVGRIKDIATIDQENYRIEIERNHFRDLVNDYTLNTELQLVLQCPKQKIDSLLKEHPDFNGIAVIADIKEIETKTTIITEADESIERKVGKGKCIDILYTGLNY